MSFRVLRFDRASSRYESEAAVQARMAGRLIGLLNSTGAQDISSVLELGCGTGILTRKLQEHFPGAFILATDAAPAMLAQARKWFPKNTVAFAEQDANDFTTVSAEILGRTPFDCLASNALVQWFPNLENHLRGAAQWVRKGGLYVLSGFESSNFPELNALLSQPPFSYHSFPGHASEAIPAISARSGWTAVKLDAWEEKDLQPSARDVLHRLQSLGSTRDPGEGGGLNRRTLQYLLSEYERRFSEVGGVRLTWKPWIAVLQKN